MDKGGLPYDRQSGAEMAARAKDEQKTKPERGRNAGATQNVRGDAKMSTGGAASKHHMDGGR